MLRSTLERIFRDPLTAIFLIAAAFFALAFLNVGEFVAYLAQGGLAKAFNGLLAIALGLLAIRVTTFLRLTLSNEEAGRVSSDPVARAILSAGRYIFAGLVALAIFG